MIAYCGLDCSKCDAYLATIENSDIKRMETARKWSKMLRHKIKPEQVNCEGCRSGGMNFFHCTKCKIRQCCISKNIDHCAACTKYICSMLAPFLKLAPEAGLALEKLRK